MISFRHFTFTAFCKNPADENWYVFDDTQVKETNEDQIVTRAAYLLFYQRRSVHNSAIQNHNWICNLVKNFNHKQLKYKPPARMNQSHDALLDSNYGKVTCNKLPQYNKSYKTISFYAGIFRLFSRIMPEFTFSNRLNCITECYEGPTNCQILTFML